ncbi:MAG: NAD(P)-dependent oxidoreductase [Pseudomonadota bacterium]|nr:NAD(P)-dependent oxidoreductase [Pseudomonadota bacterium]
MIVGNGQIANALEKYDRNDVCILASGVSDSKCTDRMKFKRERDLISRYILENPRKKIIYFSSCALSSTDYLDVAYYRHKKDIEQLIKRSAQSWLIFRVPQLFGPLKEHPTLINFLFQSIRSLKEFTLNEKAYRYVIDIDDLTDVVEGALCLGLHSEVVDVANFHRYSVREMVEIIEAQLNVKALFKTVSVDDAYFLDLERFSEICKELGIENRFSKNYLDSSLRARIQQFHDAHTNIYAV